MSDKEVEKREGIVVTIYEDFDAIGGNVVKEKAVAFLLNDSNKGRTIVIYDKNAIKLGLIKVGEPLTCFGSFEGIISVIDSKGKIEEDRMFICRAIAGNADIDEEELKKQGAVFLK